MLGSRPELGFGFTRLGALLTWTAIQIDFAIGINPIHQILAPRTVTFRFSRIGRQRRKLCAAERLVFEIVGLDVELKTFFPLDRRIVVLYGGSDDEVL